MGSTHEFVLRERPRTGFGQRLAVAAGLAIVAAALTFFVCLFIAIIGLMFVGFYRHAAGQTGSFSQLVDMRIAYRMIALPIAAAALPIAFAASFWFQSRPRRLPRT
jgi:hypothetical protein